MSLRTRIALVLLVAFGLTLGGAIVVNRIVVTPQLREAEARADAQHLRRIELGLSIARRALADFAHDYAVWDETFDFFTSLDPTYLRRNFGGTMLSNMRAHGVAVLRADGEQLYRREIDPETGADRGPALPGDLLRAAIPAAAPRDGNAPLRISGLRAGDGNPFLFGAVSVKRTDGGGDSPGWIVFYRFLDQALRRQVAESMQVDFEVEDAGGQLIDSRYRDADNRLYWTLVDDTGVPLYRAIVTMPTSMVDTRLLPTSVQAAIGIAIAVFALIMWRLDAHLMRPVKRMAYHLANVRESSNYALRLQPSGSDELAQLGRECDSLIAYVEHQHGRLSDLSNRDALSGIANRRMFDERLAEFVATARRRASPLALLMCDLDAFKAYNDSLGHPAGDEVLRRFAALIGGAVTRDTDLACRYGGEEFAVLLPDTDAEGAALVAARLHERLAELAIPHPANPADAQVTVSIGAAVLDPSAAPAEDGAALVARADAALYEAKRAGRNRTVSYRST
jgi:diguanylate cyclase (GGDEF)-like protein